MNPTVKCSWCGVEKPLDRRQASWEEPATKDNRTGRVFVLPDGWREAENLNATERFGCGQTCHDRILAVRVLSDGGVSFEKVRDAVFKISAENSRVTT